jgi:hypothetical protein
MEKQLDTAVSRYTHCVNPVDVKTCWWQIYSHPSVVLYWRRSSYNKPLCQEWRGSGIWQAFCCGVRAWCVCVCVCVRQVYLKIDPLPTHIDFLISYTPRYLDTNLCGMGNDVARLIKIQLHWHLQDRIINCFVLLSRKYNVSYYSKKYVIPQPFSDIQRAACEMYVVR